MNETNETNELMGEESNSETSAKWQLRQRLKLLQKERDQRLDALSYELPDGRVIQCRLRDEQPIRNAIERMQRLGLTQQLWRLADNTVGPVTITELEGAIITGQDQGAGVWEWFMTEAGELQSGI